MIDILLASAMMQNVSPYSPHEEPPIAYFDVVPQQDVTGVFEMGVIAYHLEGVDRVEYTIHREGFEGDFNKDGTVDGEDISVLFQNWYPDGGKALSRILAHWGTATPIADEIVSVYDQTLNPRTGQEEYWFAPDTRLYPDVKMTVTAEVFPVDGPSLVLDTHWTEDRRYAGVDLFSNNYGQFPVHIRYVSPNGNDETGDGTLENPYKGIYRAIRHDFEVPYAEVGGTMVYLMEGDHIVDESGGWPYSSLIQPSGRFITITPAPGVDRESCKLVGSDQGQILYKNWVKFDNIVFESEQDHWLDHSSQAMRWYNDVDIRGTEKDYMSEPQIYCYARNNRYFTNVLQSRLAEGINGVINRNMTYDFINCDVLHGQTVQLVLDCVITNHSDIYDLNGCHNDFIQYNTNGAELLSNQIWRNVYGNEPCMQQGVHACVMAREGSRADNIAWINVTLSNMFELDHCTPVVFRWCGPTRNMLMKDCIFVGREFFTYDQFNEDGSLNELGPWTINSFDGLPKYKNFKIEDCWEDWEKTEALFPVPDESPTWSFYGPEELQWDSNENDDVQENPFGPNDPWYSPITGIFYTQTK